MNFVRSIETPFIITLKSIYKGDFAEALGASAFFEQENFGVFTVGSKRVYSLYKKKYHLEILELI